jgi:O-antigen/teichoic acid export membrane protein
MLRLLQAVASTAGASLVGHLLGILTNKILAVVMGPAGVGIYGLYRQLLDTSAAVMSIGSAGGLVQGLSSTEGEARLRRLKAALVLNSLAILTSAIVLVVLAPILAEKYFVRPDPKVELAVAWLGLPMALIQISMMMWNFIGISQSFRWLAIVMVAPALGSLAVAFPLASLAAADNQWGYLGLLIVPPAMQIALALPIIRRLGWLRQIRASLGVQPARADYHHYFRMHGTAVLAYAMSLVVFLVLPPLIVANYGYDANGFYRVAWTLGVQNLAIPLTSLSAYLYPVMSGAKTEEERLQLFDDAAVVVSMLALPLVAGLILFQPLVIRILFAETFLPAIDMLQWMLLGGYFKIAWWLFINVSTTRAHMALYTVTDTGLWFGLLVIGGLAVAHPAGQGPIPWLSGIEGIGIAYFATYVLTTAVTVFVTWKRYGVFTRPRLTAFWLFGLAVVVLCAIVTWRSHTVNWPVSIGLSLVACAAPLMMVDASRRAQVADWWRRLRGGQPAA